jgi:CMP-N-acetylneuraminic acid synthetase
MQLSAIVPIKRQSERVPGKNFRSLCGRPLFEYVLETLAAVEEIDEIVIDTDCGHELKSCCALHPKIALHDRAAALCGNRVVMNELLTGNLASTRHEHIVQTHVTNPLLTANTIRDAIRAYREKLGEHDSLVSVTPHQKRFYDHQHRPINHDWSNMLPTQELDCVYEENSNLFIFSKASFYTNGNNRIGLNPQLFATPWSEAIDIDCEEDFRMAELLMQSRLAEILR